MSHIKYIDARSKIRTGDVIAFSGKGFISNTIKAVTGSPVTHIGMILSSNIIENISFVQIAESTSIGNGFKGVQFNRLSDHIARYDGDMWWLPLKDELRANMNVIDLISFIFAQKGKKYDTPQAIGSALDFIPDNREDLDKLFCSELVTAALEHVGILKDINASEQTPADVVGFDIYSGIYNLKGDENLTTNWCKS